LSKWHETKNKVLAWHMHIKPDTKLGHPRPSNGSSMKGAIFEKTENCAWFAVQFWTSSTSTLFFYLLRLSSYTTKTPFRDLFIKQNQSFVKQNHWRICPKSTLFNIVLLCLSIVSEQNEISTSSKLPIVGKGVLVIFPPSNWRYVHMQCWA
jgi:hypothetical protein